MPSIPNSKIIEARREFARVNAGTLRDNFADSGRCRFLCDYLAAFSVLKKGRRVTARGTRLERFRLKHKIGPLLWSNKAGITRQSFDRVREGNDTHLSTVRAIVGAASDILGRQVRASELFELGEDTPISEVLITRRVVFAAYRKRLTKYPTRLDRILRGEGIMPNDFARHAGINRHTLLRFRAGREGEPSVLTLASIVRTLRLMTGKPYMASHLYDVGEGLRDLRAT